MSTTTTFNQWFESNHTSIPLSGALAILKLKEEGSTLPFIARYRKEQTGGLDEVAIQAVFDAQETWDTITKRQAYILEEIKKQNKLTPELEAKINSTFDSHLLEDLYLPYKVKKKSKATLAKEAGLTDLADWLWNVGQGTVTPEAGQTLELWAYTFKNEEKGFADSVATLAGAQDILIERLSESQELRQKVRQKLFNEGFVKSQKADKAKPNSKFENYFNFHEKVSSLREPGNSHRYLALKRGWIEEELAISLGGAPDDLEFEAELLRQFEAEACPLASQLTAETHPTTLEAIQILKRASRLALKAHVLPSIENEVQKTLKEIADEVAIRVFADNVKKLLLASPFGPKAVLGVDPGIRTGCKLAVINDAGKFVGDTVVHLQTEDEKKRARELLEKILPFGDIKAIAVGNGTAGRETETFFRQVVKSLNLTIPVIMVNESGASVYSASEAAREEFPELDVTVRGAISIARRMQDPLAELVKVDPKAIGVGQYQHDVSPHSLKKSLEVVVDTCVNTVGVNLNTASYHLLSHVSGIGPSLAKAVVDYRGVQGVFKSRKELLKVPRFSQKTFEQAAGFLRVSESDNPLDNTGVHPERYELIENLAQSMSKTVKDLMGDGIRFIKDSKEFKAQVGEFTYKDILEELAKPGRDPRDGFVPFQYRDDIFEVKDLTLGMTCPGIVTNVTNFGAFVDIGVHQDGLVHISQLSDQFVKDPRLVVNPGDRVTVKVLEVNLEKNQIALTMKLGEKTQHRDSRELQETQSRGKPQRKERSYPKPTPSANPTAALSVKGTTSSGSGSNSSRPQKSQHRMPERPQFTNNPFAALAGLKSGAKGK